MRNALQHEENPLDADLEKVLPGVHQWHNAINAQVERLEQKTNHLTQGMSNGFQTLHSSIVAMTEVHQERLSMACEAAAATLRTPVRASLNSESPVGTESPAICYLSDNEAMQIEVALDVLKIPPMIMHPRHDSLRGMWDEWHGVGRYPDANGGIEGRNNNLPPSWRKQLHPQLYSRTSRIIQAIKGYAEKEGISSDIVICEWEPIFKEELRCSLVNFVTRLQQMGHIPKKKARGIKKNKADHANAINQE